MNGSSQTTYIDEMQTTDFSPHPHLILSQTRREEQEFSLLQKERSGISFKLLMHDLVIESGILTSTNNHTTNVGKKIVETT